MGLRLTQKTFLSPSDLWPQSAKESSRDKTFSDPSSCPRESQASPLSVRALTAELVRIFVYLNFIIHQFFPEFLQPLRDLRIQRVAQFYRVFIFGSCWLGFHQVAHIYHQPKLILALESCQSQFDSLVLEFEFHLL